MRVVKVMNSAPSIKNIQSYCLRHLSLSPSINSQIVHLKKKFAKREGVQPTEIEIDVNNQFEKLAETVTPLANKPYNVQLKIKRDWSRYVLNQFVSSKKKELCTIESTIPSPVLEGYRNKSEFSIRNGADGNPKTVGTFIGSAGLGRSICVPPTHLINTPQIHKDICKSFEDYIRSSDLPACHDLHDGGFWRPILIRSNRKGECMLCIAVHPGDKTEAQIDEQMNALKDYFTERRDQLQLASLYFQICKHSRCTNESAPYRLLYGEPHLIEKIGGYEFQISPDSFFQVNVEAAEKLYEAIFRVADMKPYSLLLDLCCGTGVVSILGSSSVRSCVGVDCVLQAVQDATENARINNIQNCAFLKGFEEGSEAIRFFS
ncbi:tRNA (uracil(54)-C(5))-methyltransferase homolog-B isoform X2 [Nilaparvata lugens]|uniref:tRNA (uracil(54)-C(5))-methyltransferase homolog-B isoform X2 n=1 Tax=Nilaparvata lugens TaxID=108931 RepID=UPI00193DD868|nr:tRNA (uracil(54)-C(5))-methyltransferase homolog-B isoform X2 [Nilaparvata lugens]